ncbi:MAG: glycoside hydrolase [Gemmatimonadota bacterium]|nr:glycoside hydrolase [Gemmatimonadota bacterium]
MAPRRNRGITALLCLAITVACDAPLEWGRVSPLAGGTTAGRRLVGRTPAHVALVEVPRSSIALPAGGCPASVVFAAARAERYAAWWRARADSGMTLVVARSGNAGREWDAAVVADARDRSNGSCDRPPPAIAADSSSGYVHLAYFLRSADGSGVWFTHSMDGGLSWHAPVGITFGDNPARTAVASLGDTVVVAYEDPSGDPRRIGIAISRTMGHIFEERLPVTGTEGSATDPLLLLRPGAIAVAWTSRAGGADSSASAALIRWGLIRATPHR